jgi:hypothetical protein
MPFTKDFFSTSPLNDNPVLAFKDNYSVKLDVGLLRSQAQHLGKRFFDGLLINTHLAPDSLVLLATA